MKKTRKQLIQEDQEFVRDLEVCGYEPIENEQEEVKRITRIFQESGNKVKRVNIRMTERDVEKAQAIALREGIPYATLLTNILHKHLTQTSH